MSGDITDRETLKQRIRAAGLRSTSGRVAVLRCLTKAAKPLSHADVMGELGDLDVDKATVYRNLVDMAEAGLLRRSDIGDHVWRFEILDADGEAHGELHAHFVCSDCGLIECLPEDAVQVKPFTGGPWTVGAGSVEVHIRGLCNDCD